MSNSESTEYLFLKRADQQKVLLKRSLDMAATLQGVSVAIFLDKSARQLAEAYGVLQPEVYPATERPLIAHLNIGKEKVSLVQTWTRESLGLDIDPSFPSQVIDRINDTVDLFDIFGAENTEELIGIVESFPRGKRVVVDDVYYSGATEILTAKIMSILDPGNKYEHFYFLGGYGDYKSQEPFYDEHAYGAKIPWYRYYTLVADKPNNPGAFTTIPQDDYGTFSANVFKDELAKLMKEAARLKAMVA